MKTNLSRPAPFGATGGARRQSGELEMFSLIPFASWPVTHGGTLIPP